MIKYLLKKIKDNFYKKIIRILSQINQDLNKHRTAKPLSTHPTPMLIDQEFQVLSIANQSQAMQVDFNANTPDSFPFFAKRNTMPDQFEVDKNLKRRRFK